MLKRPSNTVLRQLTALHNTPVHEWLTESLSQIRQSNDTAVDLGLSWGQGRAQLLSQLIIFIDSSEKYLQNSLRDDVGGGSAP